MIRAIYDPLTWSYGDFDRPDPLEPVLIERLHGLSTTAASSSLKLALWKQLAEAELGSYLNYLLEKHWMSGALAPGLLSRLAPEMELLSLGQRRYIAWAGVREGAAAFLRFLGDPNKAYDSMIVDMRRRARWVASDPESSVEFVPAQGWRRPILLSLFIEEMTSLGEQYWRMVPTQSALDQFGRARRRKSA